MISIFTIPKPFQGHIGVIQRNALRSWVRLHPEVQVIVCGDEPGCQAIANELGADHLSDIARNEYGTPLLNDAFARAEARARHNLLAYVNCDIILFKDLVEAAWRTPLPRWLMVGRRVDLDLRRELTAAELDAPQALRTEAAQRGVAHGVGGMDYFLWPRVTGLGDLPPLAVGRPGWDNYFVCRTRYERRLPVIDATEAVLAIHQNHDYAHVPGGNGRNVEGPEAARQRAQLGHQASGSVYDASHVMTPAGLRRATGFDYRRARAKRRRLTRWLLAAECFVGRVTHRPRRIARDALTALIQRNTRKDNHAATPCTVGTTPADSPTVTLLTRMFWPDAFGGVERRTRRMAEAFTEAGVCVDVLTMHGAQREPREQRLAPGYRVLRMPPPGIGRQWRWRELVHARWWARAIRQHRPTGWLWASEPLAAMGAILAGAGDRLIYNPPWCAAAMHDVWRADRQVWTQRTRWLLRWIERYVYRRAARIVTASDNLREQLVSAYGQRPGRYVVHHGVDTPTETQPDRTAVRRGFGIAEQELVIGMVGRVEPVKDLPFLLDALAISDGAVDRLMIVGDGPERPRLEQLAEQRGLVDRVLWTGRLDDPTPAYRAMDVMVLPSVYESFGNVVPEAMAAGVPVIGRRRSTDPARPVLVTNEELIDHGRTGFLVDPHDPADLAALLQRLRDDRPILRTMGEAARTHAASRPWSKVVAEYLDVLGITEDRDTDVRRAA